MSNRAKISMVVRGMIVGGLATLAIVLHSAGSCPVQESVPLNPDLVMIDADFSNRVVEPVTLGSGASIPINVQFE